MYTLAIPWLIELSVKFDLWVYPISKGGLVGYIAVTQSSLSGTSSYNWLWKEEQPYQVAAGQNILLVMPAFQGVQAVWGGSGQCLVSFQQGSKQHSQGQGWIMTGNQIPTKSSFSTKIFVRSPLFWQNMYRYVCIWAENDQINNFLSYYGHCWWVESITIVFKIHNSRLFGRNIWQIPRVPTKP